MGIGIKVGTSGQINNNIVTDGLVFYVDAAYKKSYVSGSTTTNSLVGNITGSLVNDVGFSPYNQGVFMFDGTDDYINVSGLSSAFQISQGSIEAWIKPSSDGSDQMVCGLGGGSTFGATRVIRIYGNQWGFVGYGSANQDWSSITPVTFNTWAHVVIGWNGTALTFWLNGTRYDAVRSGIVTPNNSVISLGVSTWNTSNRPFEGDIATFRMYSRLLSNDEVLQNYNAGKGRFDL
jgi:hypothetical protein